MNPLKAVARHPLALTGDRPNARVWAIAGVAVIVLAGVLAYAFKVSGKMPDFDVYLTAGSRVLSGEPLYRVEDGHYQFKYLPAFAVLMAPVASVNPALARAAWFAASVALIPILIGVCLALVPEHRRPAIVLGALTTAVLAKFLARELVLGQVNLLFAVVVCGAMLAMASRREGTAGWLVALAIVLKPYGVILVPWLLARRNARSVAAALAGAGVALLLPSLAYGLDGNIALHRDWWSTVISTTAPNLLNPDNVSWLAMYTRWFGAGTVAATLTAATIALAAAAALAVWFYRTALPRPDVLEGALLLVFIPLLSPQGWDYVLLLAAPAVMLLVNYAAHLPSPLRWLTVAALAITGASIYDLMGGAAYRGFMAMSGITICFFVIVAALIALRLRRVA